MAASDFAISIDIIDKNAPQILQVRAVDRSILSDKDVSFVLDQLQSQSGAPTDDQPHNSYLGVDIFYGKDHAVKGLVFATQSRALAIRIPDGTTKLSAAKYEQKLAKPETAKEKPQQRPKGKTKPNAPPETSPYERLSNLLKSNLAAFGMAQISLTLWDTLRERVEGINLSTAVSEKIPPPSRIVPDPNAPADAGDAESPPKREKQGASRGGKKENNQGNRGGKHGKGGRGGKSRGGKGGSGGGGKEKDQETPDPVEKRKTKTITLPEDQEPFWDREILSPGDVIKIIYPSTSRLGVNKSFIGQAGESSIEDRLVEAAVRAWVSHIVANHNQLSARVQEAPVIKPSYLNDEELTFFSKSMISAWKVMGETEAGRVIERQDLKTAEKDMLQSTVYKSKLRAGNNQEMTFLMKDGTEKSYFIKRPWGEKYGKHTRLTEDEDAEEQPESSDRAPRESGEGGGKGRGKRGWNRKGQVRDEVPDSSDIFDQTNIESTGSGQAHEIDMEEVQEISLYGREDATRAEIKRDLFILRLLEGRGSLRGPEYKDCEFIRRVWFPTPAQKATGEARKKKYEPLVKEQQHDWMDDSWGDDTDEEEAPRKNNAPAPNLVDNDTEDEDLGHDLERNQIVPRLAKKVNDSQLRVIGRVTAPNSTGRTRATLVHGPPGTGKTTTIIVAASRLIEAGEPVWIVAQSNVGIRNVAVSLAKRDTNFVLLVAKDFYIWKEDELYKDLKPFLIPTAQLKLESQRKRVHSTKLILCTLASLSSVLVEKFEVFNYVPLRNLIIDEASQIDMTSEFMHLFFNHRHTLKNVCWFGDPLQLPPYGWSEDRKIDDIFKVAHLKANSKLLNVSFRLPVPIANYISEAVYESTLEADLEHDVKKPAEAVLFVDVPEGVERREENGTSYMNDAEADLVVKIVQLYFNSEADRESKERFAIITPYEAQRTLLNQKLKEGGIDRTAFNVDSYQGNEADYIITTITKTTFSSFLSSINRLNVLITRCRKGLIVLTQKDFILRTGGLLRGLWWSMESHIKTFEYIPDFNNDVRNGRVKLLGSLAPTRGVPTDQNVGESTTRPVAPS